MLLESGPRRSSELTGKRPPVEGLNRACVPSLVHNRQTRDTCAAENRWRRSCVSQAILDGCTGVPVRAVGRVLLKGKTQPLQAFEPMATTDPAACADPAGYAAVMHLMQPGEAHQPWLARDVFEHQASRHPYGPLVALHMERLREGATDDLIVLADK